jgi:hypothetical protein
MGLTYIALPGEIFLVSTGLAARPSRQVNFGSLPRGLAGVIRSLGSPLSLTRRSHAPPKVSAHTFFGALFLRLRAVMSHKVVPQSSPQPGKLAFPAFEP